MYIAGSLLVAILLLLFGDGGNAPSELQATPPTPAVVVPEPPQVAGVVLTGALLLGLKLGIKGS